MKYFNLYFTGKALESVTIEQLKINLSKLFKKDLSHIEKMFTGKPVVIKKSISAETVVVYRRALEQAGAKIIVKEIAHQELSVIKVPTNKAPVPKISAPLMQPPEAVAATNAATNNATNNATNAATNAATNNAATNAATNNAATNAATNSEQMSSGLAGLINYNQSIEESQIKDPDEEEGWTLIPLHSGSLEEFSTQNKDFELPDLSDYSLSEAGIGSLQEYAPRVVPVEIRDTSYMDITDKNDRPLSDQDIQQTATQLPDIQDLNMSDSETGDFEEFVEKIADFDLESIPEFELEIDGQQEK
ncbi:MAG: hypothetical protein QM479_05920 [Pseudomonadota bacterium]